MFHSLIIVSMMLGYDHYRGLPTFIAGSAWEAVSVIIKVFRVHSCVTRLTQRILLTGTGPHQSGSCVNSTTLGMVSTKTLRQLNTSSHCVPTCHPTRSAFAAAEFVAFVRHVFKSAVLARSSRSVRQGIGLQMKKEQYDSDNGIHKDT